MAKLGRRAPLLVLGVLSATVAAGDLSQYRSFRLGTDLPTIAKLAGVSPSQARAIHRRPALIQTLEWRPQPLAWSAKTEPAQEVIFTFLEGELFHIAVKYDRFETEGLTPDDLIDAISVAYGIGAEPPAQTKTAPGPYGDQEEILARWEDPQYRFDLIRSSYGPTFSLNGVLKRLETPAQAAILEARRLDEREAPQREAARIAEEQESAKVKLEKARLLNKPNFRP